MSRILLVEDEELIGTMVKLNLEQEAYEVDWLHQAEGALEKAQNARYDLILMDIMLPGMNGIEATAGLRKAGIGTPVLMLTARSESRTKVNGLDSGADDYLTKPFDMDELLARVRALIRRGQARAELPSESVFSFDGYRINFETRQADTNEGRIRLSEKETALLELFVRQPNFTFSRSNILEEVWGLNVDPTERTVDNFIVRLRKLFEKDPAHPRRFISVRSVGYRFEL